MNYALALASATVVNALAGLQYAILFILIYIFTKSQEEKGRDDYIEAYFMNRNGEVGRFSLTEIEMGIKENRHKDVPLEKILGMELHPNNNNIMLCGNNFTVAHLKKILFAKGFKIKSSLKTESW